MITPAEFMTWPTEQRYQALNTFQGHLAQLLLAEATVTIREKQPTAARIKIRLVSCLDAAQHRGGVELVAIRDTAGYAVSKIGRPAARRVDSLLSTVNQVWPMLLGWPDCEDGSVVTVDLPPVPDDEPS